MQEASAHVAAEQLLAEEAAAAEQARCKHAKKQRQKAKRQQQQQQLDEHALQQEAAQDAMQDKAWQHEEQQASGSNVLVQQALQSTEGRLSSLLVTAILSEATYTHDHTLTKYTTVSQLGRTHHIWWSNSMRGSALSFCAGSSIANSAP